MINRILPTLLVVLAISASGPPLPQIGVKPVSKAIQSPKSKVLASLAGTPMLVKHPQPPVQASISFTLPPEPTPFILHLGNASGLWVTNYGFTGSNAVTITVTFARTNLNPYLPWVLGVEWPGQSGIGSVTKETWFNIRPNGQVWLSGNQAVFTFPITGQTNLTTVEYSDDLKQWSLIRSYTNDYGVKQVIMPAVQQGWFRLTRQ